MIDIHEITNKLEFPEGPIAMDDGSVVLVEIARGTLSRVFPDGKISVIAELGGGPNGAAMGPDGKCYICNNGGFIWHRRNGLIFPGMQPDDYNGGRIERVDLDSGEVEVLYRDCDGVPLKGPNDIVFCFGGDDLMTAYITLSSTGRLIAVDWPRPGLPLNFLNC